MKFFIRNSSYVQSILFKYGYHWLGDSKEVKYLQEIYVCFVTQNENHAGVCLTYCNDVVYLNREDYIYINVDQLESAIFGKYNKEEPIFGKIPEGVTKFTYNGVDYELKTVTEKKWVKV